MGPLFKIVNVQTGRVVVTLVPDAGQTDSSVLLDAKAYCRRMCAFECDVIRVSDSVVVYRHR